MKHMKWKKATNLAEIYEVKKGKRSNIWGSILFFTQEAKIYLLSKIFFTAKHKILKKDKNSKIRQKKKKLGQTLIVFVCVHWCFSDVFHRCLLLTSCNWPRLQTNLQHVENWNWYRNRSHSEKQTEIEVEIEARNWNRNGNRNWLKTETEIETEIDYWNRDRNRDRPRKTRPKWKSTSEPKRLLEVDFESGFWDLWEGHIQTSQKSFIYAALMQKFENMYIFSGRQVKLTSSRPPPRSLVKQALLLLDGVSKVVGISYFLIQKWFSVTT